VRADPRSSLGPRLCVRPLRECDRSDRFRDQVSFGDEADNEVHGYLPFFSHAERVACIVSGNLVLILVFLAPREPGFVIE
jgi:hypothetical protein